VRLLHRTLPHPVLSASLLVIWLILNATVQPGQVLLGAILGWGLPLLTRPYWPERPPFHRLPLLWRLFLIVNWDILRANLTVARLTLTWPVDSLRPQFAVVPLDVRSPYGIALLLGIMTITPGTIAADLDEEHRLVLVHWLHEPDPASAVALIKSRYEQPLREIFG
jgi:multicomponent K+:H+ antiporter subunit E